MSSFLLTTVDINGKGKREGTAGHQVCGVGRSEFRPRQVITCQEDLDGKAQATQSGGSAC